MNIKVGAGQTITPRDTLCFFLLARYKLLTTEQLSRLVNIHVPFLNQECGTSRYKETTPTAVGNRLRVLKQFGSGWVECSYIPLNASQTSQIQRSTAVWRLSQKPKAHREIKKGLEALGYASKWDDIASILETDQNYSQQELDHNTGISEVLMADDIHTAPHPDRELVFSLRTHPTHPDLTKTFYITKTVEKKDKYGNAYDAEIQTPRTFNPDFFRCTKNTATDKYEFLVGEYDNDSKDSFIEKLEGYFVYQDRQYFTNVCRLFTQQYLLDIDDFDTISFRVLVVVNSRSLTNPMRRLHKLFALALKMPTDEFFNFATLEDFRRDPYDTIYLNKKAFAPFMDTYRTKVRDAKERAQQKWFDEHIPTVPRVSGVL